MSCFKRCFGRPRGSSASIGYGVGHPSQYGADASSSSPRNGTHMTHSNVSPIGGAGPGREETDALKVLKHQQHYEHVYANGHGGEASPNDAEGYDGRGGHPSSTMMRDLSPKHENGFTNVSENKPQRPASHRSSHQQSKQYQQRLHGHQSESRNLHQSQPHDPQGRGPSPAPLSRNISGKYGEPRIRHSSSGMNGNAFVRNRSNGVGDGRDYDVPSREVTSVEGGKRHRSREMRRNSSRNTAPVVRGSGTGMRGDEEGLSHGGAADPRETTDNNGLSRGQNFAKVEKWLRDACMHQLISIVPGDIRNLEDPDAPLAELGDPPTELDRLPPIIPSTNSHSQLTFQ